MAISATQQSAWDNYWKNTPSGTTLNWASGTLTRQDDGTAKYVDPNGNAQVLNSGMNLDELASGNDYINRQWQSEFGYQKPVPVMSNFAIGGSPVTPAVAASPTPAVTTTPTNPGLINQPVVKPATATQPVTTPTANSYQAATSTPAQWTVTPNQTVASQIDNIIAKNSPLMQQAELRGQQRAAQRGLLNSNLAAGSSQAALYDAALPIAQQDATTNATAAQTNAGFGQQTGVANQTAQNQAGQFNASQSNDLIKLGMDSQTKMQLADVEANYKMLMQSSASASDLYKQTVANMTSILTSAGMDAASKQSAINNLVTAMNAGLGIIGGINNLNLPSLVWGAPETTPAATPAPAPGLIDSQQREQP